MSIVEAARVRGAWRWRMLGCAAFVVCLVAFGALYGADPLDRFQAGPPVRDLTLEHVVFDDAEVQFKVRNNSPDEFTVRQITVNDSFWSYETSDVSLERFEAAEITLAYPWVEAVPIVVELLDSTGDTVALDLGVASQTHVLDSGTFWGYVVIGLMVGVVPVGAGLFVVVGFESLRRRGAALLVAASVGVLLFLGVDTLVDGLDVAQAVPSAFGGIEILLLCAVAVALLLHGIGHSSLTRAMGVRLATGIGLHNLGEGLAVGAALAAGRSGLGAALLFGFAIHNITEGLALSTQVEPFPWDRRQFGRASMLVSVAGLPAVAGAVLGGGLIDPTLVVVAFGIALGAIAQVTYVMGRSLARVADRAVPWAVAGGVVVMYVSSRLLA